ncbi:hypothetical protein [Nocardia sp. NPDC058480]|uniref:hypothetical protein n=1 Tax=unclassified Nocardia TaxID=2637762 RepID=UPI0036595A96
MNDERLISNREPLHIMEQQEILDEITREILPTLPHEWTRLIARGMFVGRHTDAETGIKMPNGSILPWQFPTPVWRRFQDLRKGMYTEGFGTWFEFEYILEPPARFNIRYNRDNYPGFAVAPKAEDYALENQRYPRSPQYIPDWFRNGLSAAH